MSWKNYLGLFLALSPAIAVIIFLFIQTVMEGKWLEMFMAFGVIGVVCFGSWLASR